MTEHTPRISVLVPTRMRTGLLHTMLESMITTAEDSFSVETIFRIDEDDAESMAYLQHKAITYWPTFMERIAIIVGSHLNGYATLPIMINEASRAATAPLQIVINDDVVFRTQGWDARLCEEAAKRPDGIFNLAVDTVMNNANVVFPCQSTKQVEALGFFYDPRLVYPDIWLRDVLAPFDRVVRVPDVVIEHAWVGQTEDQRRAIPLTQGAGYQALYERCVGEGREKIRAVLEEVKC